MLKTDTYAVLEFQGIVSDVPIYEPKTGRLDFIARPFNKPSLKFFAQGEVGKAFKSLIHKGSLIQLQAIPFPHMEEVGGEACRVIDWEAKRISVLGFKKTNLGKFSDARILDGLMPSTGDIADVGYVSEFYAERDEKIKEQWEEQNKDDPNL